MNHQEVVQTKTYKIWNPVFIKLFIVNILIHFSFFVMNTLSATYADYLGAPVVIVGFVSSLFALTALIFKLISAPAIDAFNRRNVLIAAVVILFVSFIGYHFSTTIPMLIGSRLLTGVGIAFTATTCITLASDSLPFDKMSAGISIFSLGSVMCQAIAPAIGLKLVETVGYQSTFLILAIILLFALAVTATIKTNFTRLNKFVISLRGVYAREVLIPTIILFLLNTTFSAVNAFLVLFAAEKGINSNIGYFFTIYALGMLISRPVIGRLADKFGTVKIFIPSMILFAFSFLLISFSNTLPIFLAAGFISAFGFGGFFPALLAVCMKRVPKDRRGAASSTSYIGLDLANLTGPVLAGAIVGFLNYESMWRLMIFPVLIAIVIGIIFRDQISDATEVKVAVSLLGIE